MAARPMVTRLASPVLFTAEAWASLSEDQRAYVRARRAETVAAMQSDHERRYRRCDGRVAAMMAEMEGRPRG